MRKDKSKTFPQKTPFLKESLGAGVPGSLEEGVRYPVAGISGDWKPPDMVIGISLGFKHRSIARAVMCP